MERDLFLVCQPFFLVHFNSHAHVERDVQRTNRSHKTRISTHTLTWSVTLPSFSHSFSLKNFNSHAHVERDGTHQKTIITEEDFNSHAHVERDAAKPFCTKGTCNFNSHAHVERDPSLCVAVRCPCISTHTLTWSVTFGHSRQTILHQFQLTRSRGA